MYRRIFFSELTQRLFSCGHATLWEALSICWSVGPLVRWSVGPLVRWSIGPLVHWSVGPLVGMSVGPLVREHELKSSVLDASRCPTRHRPFGAAALLSLYFFSWSLQAWHQAPLTMYNPWMTCLLLPLPTSTQLGSHVSGLVLKQNKDLSPSSSCVC